MGCQPGTLSAPPPSEVYATYENRRFIIANI
ncbi:hypothetical protein AHF37_03721 [Paragonimus kellicotti]|nr:hypothetical protein AHF37_03721 [Paragonimus kellicotti]